MSSGFGGSDLNQLKDKDDIEDDDDPVNLVHIRFPHYHIFPIAQNFVRGTSKLMPPRLGRALVTQVMLHSYLRKCNIFLQTSAREASCLFTSIPQNRITG